MNNLLGAKTHFSLGESIYDPEALVKKAELAGYDGLVVTDVESIDAMPILMSKAKTLRIGLGVQMAVVEDLTWVAAKRGEPKRKPNPVFVTTLFVRNEQGFRDLCELMTLAQQEDHYCTKPARAQISREELIEFVSRGNLTMTLGSAYSAFTLRDKDKLLDMLCDHLDVSQVLAEVVPVNSMYYDAHNAQSYKAFEERGIKAIVTRPTLNQKGESSFRSTMNSILSHDKADSMWRREPPEDLYVLEQAEWLDQVAKTVDRICNRVDDGADGDNVTEWLNDALAKTNDYFKDHPYQWKKLEPSLPTMSATPMADIVAICKQGWKDRLGTEVFGYKPASADLPKYQDRLKYELSILQKMKFEAYFQLVHYVVNWSKTNEIMVGPGRGSVGGSLVAYLMGITDVDPIRFNLIFERFINPERIDLPDVDLDFMSSRRQDIVDHLVSKFGNDHVVQIANYNTLAGAGAIQAVGKAYGLHESEYDCSKLVPKESGVPVPLEKAVAYVPELEKLALNHPQVWATSVGLQGTFKNFAKHAAGVVVAGDKIVHRGVVNNRQGVGIVNWDKRVVEDFGLIKLDVLGLSNLDILRLCKDYIHESSGVSVDFTRLPLDDKKVLQAFAEAKTYGVFQFESGGMRKLLKELGSTGTLTFEDCVAATALYRPGPMQAGLMEMYVAIKKEFQEPEYLHPNMKAALEPTMSVMVYQEQVMQISRDLAGYTFPEADGLRKIMGKKDPVKMAEQRDKFVDGCIATSGLDHATATFIFEQIEKFAGYGFNKSHSVAYTLISYMTMWVKVYYPEAFYAACLSILDEQKLPGLAKDAQASDIYIVPPDINHSSDRYEIGFDSARGQKILYAPFQSVKGLSEKSAAAILAARKKLGRGFKNKAEMILEVDRRACNKTAQEKLDKIGAFSKIEPGQLDSRHPDRLRDQKELLPGIVVSNVKAERVIDVTGAVSAELVQIVEDYQTYKGCDGCPFIGRNHPQPVLGKKPKVMIVVDGPSYKEEEKGQMMVGDTANFIKASLTKAGLKMSEVYVTSYIKARKLKDEEITNVTANGCGKFLEREIALLKPPVIVALGSKSVRQLVPDIKGGWEDNCGKSFFDPKSDCTVVSGFNPAMICFDGSKQALLDQVFQQVADIFS
jgi:DNA polymerase-3 subunit alpha